MTFTLKNVGFVELFLILEVLGGSRNGSVFAQRQTVITG